MDTKDQHPTRGSSHSYCSSSYANFFPTRPLWNKRNVFLSVPFVWFFFIHPLKCFTEGRCNAQFDVWTLLFCITFWRHCLLENCKEWFNNRIIVNCQLIECVTTHLRRGVWASEQYGCSSTNRCTNYVNESWYLHHESTIPSLNQRGKEFKTHCSGQWLYRLMAMWSGDVKRCSTCILK